MVVVVQRTEVRAAASFDLWPEGTQPRVALGPGAVFAVLQVLLEGRHRDRRCRGAWWYSDRAVLQRVGRVQRAEVAGGRACCVGETAGNWALRWGWLLCVVQRRAADGGQVVDVAG